MSRFNHLLTKQGEALSGQPWNVYPRPQFKRDSFLCLNGDWDFAVTAAEERPVNFPETIRVPFPPESILSGVGRTIPDGKYLCYKTTFTLPEGFLKGRLLLHIGAADQITSVFVNGVPVGSHTGGYHPFSFDITDFLKEENELLVRVVDYLDSCTLPYGKQKHKRGGQQRCQPQKRFEIPHITPSFSGFHELSVPVSGCGIWRKRTEGKEVCGGKMVQMQLDTGGESC